MQAEDTWCSLPVGEGEDLEDCALGEFLIGGELGSIAGGVCIVHADLSI